MHAFSSNVLLIISGDAGMSVIADETPTYPMPANAGFIYVCYLCIYYDLYGPYYVV